MAIVKLNFNLNTTSVRHANDIAANVSDNGQTPTKPGMLKCTTATGIYNKDYDWKTFKRKGNNAVHRFDFGWNFAAGVDVDQFYFGFGYEFGFLKLYDNNNWKPKNGCFMFNFGYYL